MKRLGSETDDGESSGTAAIGSHLDEERGGIAVGNEGSFVRVGNVGGCRGIKDGIVVRLEIPNEHHKSEGEQCHYQITWSFSHWLTRQRQRLYGQTLIKFLLQ